MNKVNIWARKLIKNIKTSKTLCNNSKTKKIQIMNKFKAWKNKQNKNITILMTSCNNSKPQKTQIMNKLKNKNKL